MAQGFAPRTAHQNEWTFQYVNLKLHIWNEIWNGTLPDTFLLPARPPQTFSTQVPNRTPEGRTKKDPAPSMFHLCFSQHHSGTDLLWQWSCFRSLAWLNFSESLEHCGCTSSPAHPCDFCICTLRIAYIIPAPSKSYRDLLMFLLSDLRILLQASQSFS